MEEIEQPAMKGIISTVRGKPLRGIPKTVDDQENGKSIKGGTFKVNS